MKPARKREIVLWVVCALLSFSLFCVITLARWGIHLWDKAIDYNRFGTWSDAASGIGTSAALIVALAAFFWERSNRRSEEADRLREAETAIFQWITSKEVRDTDDNLLGRVWDIKIQNSTVSPIYRWKLTFGSRQEFLCNHLKRPLIPGENVFNLPFLDNLEPNKVPEPTLTFEGRSGRIWTRSSRGLLEEATTQGVAYNHQQSSPNAFTEHKDK
jgi:hypothetical protein